MPNKTQNYDSSGPDIRVRGNAYQVLEKYLQLARDAGTAGDRVAAENFLQHADHYYRVVSAMSEGQRPRIGGREVSVADVNVHNVSQGLSAALSGHGHSNAAGDDGQSDMQPGNNGGDGNGNGQNRAQQHHQQQMPREGQGNNGQGNNGQGSGQAGDQPQVSASESGGNSYAEPRRSHTGDEQPDYPDEPSQANQQQAQPNGDGGAPSDGRQNSNRVGRGRRRGPGRRVRSEGEDQASPAPAGESDGGNQ
jgi:hypothetical protein